MDDEAAFQAVRDHAEEDEEPKMIFFLKKMQPVERKDYFMHITPKELVAVLRLELGGLELGGTTCANYLVHVLHPAFRVGQGQQGCFR